MLKSFLPVTQAEIDSLGWEQPDIIIISGDAYIDHPSFAAAIIGRWLQQHGYRTAILPQPDWKNPASFEVLGKPRLFFGITSGNMDSMINKYTARHKLRSQDAYSPDGRTDLRPDRATLVYSQIVHSLYKDVPIVLGGIEASMRRLPHYDFWSDKLRNSSLFDSRAHYLVYGMGERAVLQIAQAIADNTETDNIPGTAIISGEPPPDAVILPEYHAEFTKDEFWQMHRIYEQNYRNNSVYQNFAGRWLKLNVPAAPLNVKEMDSLYDLPFTREPHPVYKGQVISAFEQIKTSVTTHRGCFGGCSFCGIGYHQGKSIQSRSKASVIREIKDICCQDYFRGTISDLGGPSANMYGMYCTKDISETCPRASCLYPQICPHLNSDHQPLRKLLQKAATLKDINHVFVASGIRFDLALKDSRYIKEIAEQHTGGLLKLAPEHKSSRVLNYMRKPDFQLYKDFLKLFSACSRQAGKKQTVVPYIIIGHPAATLADTLELAVYLKTENVKLRQIQEYIPLPMTDSALMYYTEKDLQGNKIHVARGREIRLMKALIQWYDPQNRKLIIEALKKAQRTDLFGVFLD
jgi:uncharacterized radical SAM protein YgiQ